MPRSPNVTSDTRYLSGSSLQELGRRVARGEQARRAPVPVEPVDVLRVHRARDVHREHDRRAFARDVDRSPAAARTRPAAGQRDQEEHERDVAPAARAGSGPCSAAAPARRPALAPSLRPVPLEQHVADDRQPARAAGTAAARASAKLIGRSALRFRNAASGRSQSPSVESATWRTPAEESSRTRPSRSSAAAASKRSRSRALARVDAQLAARLGIDEPELADVGELLLARVADLDRDGRMPAGDAQQRLVPVDRAAEVGDDDDERALDREPVDDPQRLAERALAGRHLAQPAEREQQPAPALARPAPVGSSGPNATRPSRLPRRVATWPTASATPSATSALRRSAVPNAIEADESNTSQVTSTRSASSTRTCGVPVRAVTFQSMRRTSSPGSYGPHLEQLAAEPGEGGAVVARQQAVDPPADLEVERAQRLARDRPGARAGGRPLAPDGLDEALHAAAGARPRSICGVATFFEHLVEHHVGVDLLGERLVGRAPSCAGTRRGRAPPCRPAST